MGTDQLAAVDMIEGCRINPQGGCPEQKLHPDMQLFATTWLSPEGKYQRTQL
jgi:hypothetical protein